VGGGAAEQLDRAAVDQWPQHRRPAVEPAGLQVGEAGRGRAELVARQGAQVRFGTAGEHLCAQLPVADPGVQLAQRVRVVEHRGDDRRHAEREHVAAALGGELFNDRHYALP
jgi:hypothetical protein